MDGVMEVRQPRERSLTQRERIREWFLYGVIVLLFVGAITASIAYLVATTSSDPLQRSDTDMIGGGKRFIDWSYSLNASSVDVDQFRALKMIVNEELRETEKKRVIRQDLIRGTRSAMMGSRIDWSRAKIDILKKHPNGLYEIEYFTYLVRNGRSANPIHLVLYLIPVERSDDNVDGVGVVGWEDFANKPFIKDETGEARE